MMSFQFKNFLCVGSVVRQCSAAEQQGCARHSMAQDLGEHVGIIKCFDILHQMDFKPSEADPDIWMKLSKDATHYEYIAVYVDDLATCMQDPQAFCEPSKKNTNSR